MTGRRRERRSHRTPTSANEAPRAFVPRESLRACCCRARTLLDVAIATSSAIASRPVVKTRVATSASTSVDLSQPVGGGNVLRSTSGNLCPDRTSQRCCQCSAIAARSARSAAAAGSCPIRSRDRSRNGVEKDRRISSAHIDGCVERAATSPGNRRRRQANWRRARGRCESPRSSARARAPARCPSSSS